MRLQIQPVLLAGGSGTRLWPLSRAGFPKQFLVLEGQYSLLQQAAQRLASLQKKWDDHASGLEGQAGKPSPALNPIVVGNEEHRFLILDQLREVHCDPAALLLEPVGRNTAPAVTLAALQAMAAGEDPVLVVTPADHAVSRPDDFAESLRQACQQAANGAVVIVGVQPEWPETGFGYIQAPASDEPGEFRSARPAPEAAAEHRARSVIGFVEKPDRATAEGYLAQGDYFWNGGIFVLRASTWTAALQRFRPDILEATRRAFDERQTDQRFVRPGKDAFAAIPAESVDYAVLEKCPGSGVDIRMVPMDAGWNDLGAWDAVWLTGQHDEAGNVLRGDVLMHDSQGSLVHATHRLVGVIGLKDVVVVETPDAVLVSDRSRSQEVRHVVQALGRSQRSEQTLHRKVVRPWGWYDCIDAGERFQVKRIGVKPGASLSLQKHHHRAEHWIVVRGTAEVTCGDKTLLLTENQSTYIPLGETHRLSNPGKVMLEIIEVQSGSYLGEDDIVRLEDHFGRC